jgi:hypothetical protein
MLICALEPRYGLRPAGAISIYGGCLRRGRAVYIPLLSPDYA